MIQVVLVGLCCTTLKDQLRRVVNVSAFRLIQYRKSKTKVLIFANQSAGEYHKDQWELKGSKTRLTNSLVILVWIWLIEKVARNFQTNHIGVRQNQSVPGLLLTLNTFAKFSVTTFVYSLLFRTAQKLLSCSFAKFVSLIYLHGFFIDFRGRMKW